MDKKRNSRERREANR